MHMRPTETNIISATKVFTLSAAVFFVLIVLLFSTAWAGTATDQLKGTIDKALKVLNDQSLKTPDKQNEKRAILSKLIRERFDWQEIARRALGVHWQGRTKEERQEFVKLFSSLLERTYLDKLDKYLAKANSFSGKQIHYISEKIKEPYAVVETKVITDQDIEIPIHYRLKNKQNNWLVIDLAIEGVSLVKNYRTQFNEILASSSFQDFMKKLREKLS